jgi:ABC-2 type transport system permease protein
MRWLAAFYGAYCRLSLAIELQYRAALLIWQIGAVLGPTVRLVVWSAAARANGGAIGDFAPADFAAYYLALLVTSRLTATYIMFVFERNIREGLLSAALLRPLHPIHAAVAEMATHNAISTVVLVPAVIGLAAYFRPALDPPPWAVVAFVPALALAFALRFLTEWTLALAAFWTTRVTAINQLYFTLMLFFSGQLAPLELLPAPLQTAAALLPFRAMISFPVELVLGRLTPDAALAGFATQLSWVAVALALQHLIWRAGVRRYAGVGA